MKVSRSRISKVIADKTLSSGVSKKLSQEIAAYLLKSHRTEELNSILRDVQADWAEHGVIDAIATSAFPISDRDEREIESLIRKLYPNAKKIIVNEQRDPSVIAGVRLELADKQLDLSIQTKLNRFKQLAISGKDNK